MEKDWKEETADGAAIRDGGTADVGKAGKGAKGAKSTKIAKNGAVDWALIEEAYVGSSLSLRSLAAAYGVATSTLQRHAKLGLWREKREDRMRDVSALLRGEETELPLDADGALLRVTGKLLRRAETLADAEDINARELGELMRAIKNASAIRLLHGAEDDSGSGTLSVCFSPEAEEAAG